MATECPGPDVDSSHQSICPNGRGQYKPCKHCPSNALKSGSGVNADALQRAMKNTANRLVSTVVEESKPRA